jgi:hypothetical protein
MSTASSRAGRLSRVARMVARDLGRRRAPVRRLLLPAVAVGLLATVVRVAYVGDVALTLYTWEQPGVRMALRYTEAASAILNGDGILYPRVWPDPSDTGLLSRPPGYPVFVAAVQWTLGSNYADVLAAQVVLTALLAALMLLLVTRVAGSRAGIVAGVLAAFSPPLAYHAALVTPDALTALLAVVIVFFVCRARDARPRARAVWLVAAGVVSGVATWLRPNFLLLAPLLAVAIPLVFGRRRRARAWPLALAIAAMAVVAPITIRNLRIYGEFVPVSINSGIVLWEGIADAGGQRFGARSRDLEVAAEEAVRFGDPRYAKWWASPDGIRRDRDRAKRTLEVIRAHPGWYAGSVVRRAGDVLASGAEAPLVSPSAPRLAEDSTVVNHLTARAAAALSGARPALRALQRTAAWPAAALTVVGLGLLGALAPRRALLLALVPAYVLLVQSPVHFEPRFALPKDAFTPALQATGLVAVLGATIRSARRYWM